MTYTIDPHDIGEPWHVCVDLQSTEIIIPKPMRQDPPTPSHGDPFIERHQVIILGMAWTMVCATTTGFTLTQTDASGTYNVYKAIFTGQAAAIGLADSFNCYIQLSPAGAASPAAEAARLDLVLTGAATGSITIWGVHADARGRRLQTGSPITYS